MSIRPFPSLVAIALASTACCSAVGEEPEKTKYFDAATGMDYYEAANGVGPLLIELIRLHLVITKTDYPLPRYYAET